jgi:hypothetical protein
MAKKKQVLRCAQNDNQKNKSNSNGKANAGDLRYAQDDRQEGRGTR